MSLSITNRITRDEFIKQLSAAALLTCAGCLHACSSEDDPTPATVDFTVDLSASQYSALNTVGGSVSINGIIIARISSADFTALSRACTHEGTAVNYRASQNDFLCPNHGSRFSTSGTVLQGPATRSLTRYNTQLTENSLRVFS
jgi:cytochrome b6-f complex iron-sulfur subunit